MQIRSSMTNKTSLREEETHVDPWGSRVPGLLRLHRLIFSPVPSTRRYILYVNDSPFLVFLRAASRTACFVRRASRYCPAPRLGGDHHDGTSLGCWMPWRSGESMLLMFEEPQAMPSFPLVGDLIVDVREGGHGCESLTLFKLLCTWSPGWKRSSAFCRECYRPLLVFEGSKPWSGCP